MKHRNPDSPAKPFRGVRNPEKWRRFPERVLIKPRHPNPVILKEPPRNPFSLLDPWAATEGSCRQN
jgi:hypothetical protein